MTTKAVEQELLELEKQYWQAMKDKDADTAMRLSDDPCLIAGPMGIMRIDRQALKGMLKAASYTLNNFSIGDAQVQMLGDEIAVVAYNVHEELTVEGKPVSLDAADASTWARRNGRWVCALQPSLSKVILLARSGVEKLTLQHSQSPGPAVRTDSNDSRSFVTLLFSTA